MEEVRPFAVYLWDEGEVEELRREFGEGFAVEYVLFAMKLATKLRPDLPWENIARYPRWKGDKLYIMCIPAEKTRTKEGEELALRDVVDGSPKKWDVAFRVWRETWCEHMEYVETIETEILRIIKELSKAEPKGGET